MLGSVKTYAATTRKLLETYEKTMGEPAPKLQGPPKQRYQTALSLFEKKSIRLPESLPNTQNISDIDDIPPNAFFDAMVDTIFSEKFSNDDDYLLRDFLRTATTLATQNLGATKRINVGNNLHFQRMFQYVRELEEWADAEEPGYGLQVLNAAGAGKVAQYPEGPDKLIIRIWHN
ncbi:hypothetical protein VXL81_00720 [Phaeobacter sp. JH204B]